MLTFLDSLLAWTFEPSGSSLISDPLCGFSTPMHVPQQTTPVLDHSHCHHPSTIIISHFQLLSRVFSKYHLSLSLTPHSYQTTPVFNWFRAPRCTLMRHLLPLPVFESQIMSLSTRTHFQTLMLIFSTFSRWFWSSMCVFNPFLAIFDCYHLFLTTFEPYSYFFNYSWLFLIVNTYL